MPSTPPTPNDLTRQQLDELDTLLQRMLSLPMSSPSDPPTAPPTPVPELPASLGGWRADPRTPAPIPHMAESRIVTPPVVATVRSTVADSSHPTPEPMWDPDPIARHRAAPARSEPTTLPLVPPDIAASEHPIVTGTLRGVDAPAVPFGFRSPFADPPPATPSEPASVALATAERLVTTPQRQSDRVPIPLWPVFALNWVMEVVFELFGPVGSAATRPIAKHFLGGAGILLLIAATLWSARGMGWITLPWPR